jgi:hypothetical protein
MVAVLLAARAAGCSLRMRGVSAGGLTTLIVVDKAKGYWRLQ